jgi:hypothetical protein
MHNIKASALMRIVQSAAISFLNGLEILQIFRQTNYPEVSPRGYVESHPAEDKRPI